MHSYLGVRLTQSTFTYLYATYLNIWKISSLFVCFVGISQTKPIISLNSINRLVFVMDTQCVYCEVGIHIIYISVLQTGFRKGCQGFRKTKMRNRGRILMAALNLSVRTTIRVATFRRWPFRHRQHADNPSLLQARSCLILQPVSQHSTSQSMCQANRSVWG